MEEGGTKAIQAFEQVTEKAGVSLSFRMIRAAADLATNRLIQPTSRAFLESYK
jgi:hypothetical protein